jgi:hypothetical protein
MSNIKVKLIDGSRQIELEGEFADVQQVLVQWWNQSASMVSDGGPSIQKDADVAGGMSVGKADHIGASTTWSGAVLIDRPTTVDSGATLTISAGTVISVKNAASLVIAGIVDIQGKAKAKVIIAAPTPAESHAGISVLGGGELRMHHCMLSGGGLTIGPNGKAKISDSTLTNPRTGDALAMNSGTLDMQFSEIRMAAGDGGHTALVFNGAGNSISVTHCTIRGAVYGLMFYGGQNAVFTDNNWDNEINVDATSGVSGDFSGSYFRGNAPVSVAGAALKAQNVMMSPRLDATPRA